MRADNIKFLKKYNPVQYKKTLEPKNPENYRSIKNKNGDDIILYKKNNYEYRLSSYVDPAYEADVIINEFKNIDRNKYIFLYGIGSGYHIEALLKKYPGKKLFIYEPNIEVFNLYTDLNDLPYSSIAGLLIGDNVEHLKAFLNRVLEKAGHSLILIDLPVYKSIYAEKYNDFLKLYKDILKSKAKSLAVNYKYQKHWVYNSINNFLEVIDSTNLLMLDQENFTDKPVILVGAGPSLNFEIENLKYVKENDLAYIFTIGSAVNTLLKYDIHADAAFSYHPDDKNVLVLQKIKKNNIIDIPLVFGSSINHKSLKTYPGPKAHVLTSQDTISKFYLNSEKEIPVVNDAPSIISITFQTVCNMGFNPVILVGQNMALLDEMDYSEGLDYRNKWTKGPNLKATFDVERVDGEVVKTNDTFNMMRLDLERYINKFENIDVLNTTRKGAKVKGTEFRSFDKVIQDLEEAPTVNKKFVEYFNQDFYDKAKVKEHSKNVIVAYDAVLNDFKNLRSILQKMETLKLNNNFNQIEKMYPKLDEIFNNIKRNKFFKLFIIPLNRVHYNFFVKAAKELKVENKKRVKVENIIREFEKLEHAISKDMKKVASLVVRIDESLRKDETSTNENN